MKENLYLVNRKLQLNKKDNNANYIYEEIQCGPMEEANIIEFNINIDKFKKYQEKLRNKRNR